MPRRRAGLLAAAAAGFGLLGAGTLILARRAPASRPPGSPAAAPPAQPPAFVNVAPEAGIRYVANRATRRPRDILETNGSGCAFLDYDGDGDLDILLAGRPRCALYRNDSGRFTEVTSAAGLSREGHWIGVGAADWDNDGDPDLCITGYRSGALYRNDGARFRDITSGSGVRFPQWGQSVAFGDGDGDGLLDLFIGAYARFGPGSPRYCPRGTVQAVCGPEIYTPEPGRFFHGLGGGRFADITRESGILQTHGRSWGAMFQDFDDDGRQDLYVGNDMVACDLLRNVGRAGGPTRFENIGVRSGTAFNGGGSPQGAMAVDWADYDNDGRPDLVVTTFSADPASLYHNDGRGQFTESSYAAGVGAPTVPYVGFGTRFLDFDNDGWRDLLLANGHVEDNVELYKSAEHYRQPLLLLRNTGGRFENVSEPLLCGLVPMVARGAAFGDYDNDGRADALVMDLEGPPLLLHNQSRGGNWLGLRLIGSRSNRDALGTRVLVTAGGRTQRLECQTSGSVLASNDPRVLVGLGTGVEVTRVKIVWPSSRTTTLDRPSVNRYLTVREPG